MLANRGSDAPVGLPARSIDGFFANGIGAELSVVKGIGNVVLDVRRGDGPKECFGYTMPSIATTDRLISERPQVAAGVVKALRKTQEMLKHNIDLATEVGKKLFPAPEAELIKRVVERDLHHVVGQDEAGDPRGGHGPSVAQPARCRATPPEEHRRASVVPGPTRT